MKVLIFYPHNFYQPRHGSHLRAMQQFEDLAVEHEICFASTKWSSDTAWSSKNEILGRIPCRDIQLFEDSILGFISTLLLWPVQKFAALCSKLLRSKGVELLIFRLRNALIRRWFLSLARRIAPDTIVIHYTSWAFLVDGVPPSSRKILEIHDLLSLNSYLRNRVRDALKIENRTIVGVNKDDPIGYVESASELPQEALNALIAEVANFRKFDLIWSISRREESLIRQVYPEAAVETIAPCFETKKNDRPTADYFLLPIGPNPFNAYSMRIFIDGVFRRLPAEIKKKIRVTGQAWGEYKFQWPADMNYLGLVDDYESLLMGARLVLAPTCVGTGQQMKIFEALACGVPVLCYRAAVPGDEVASDLLVAVDDEEGFYRRLVEFNENPATSNMGVRQPAACGAEDGYARSIGGTC